MKQNITLSIHKDLIHKARVIAAQRGTSVRKMLADELRRIVEETEAYQAAKLRALALLDEGLPLGGVISASRDELHER